MDLMTLVVIASLVCIVAALYSSVGHGGASGYLATLSFFAVSPVEMSSTALVLNVFVAGIGFITFLRARHFDFRLAWPFLLLSIPGAFVGGLIHVSDRSYLALLAIALLAAAYRLSRNGVKGAKTVPAHLPPLAIALPVGAGIGLLSGIVGVGGGIFLSPLMIFMHWADPKKTAAVSAFFILANSVAGIGGRLVRDSFHSGTLAYLIIAAVAGGLLGSYIGANKFTGLALRRVLAFVLLIATGRLVIAVLK